MIKLEEMSPGDFDNYLLCSIPHYVQELEATGEFTAEQAEEYAQRQFQELLPDGLASPGQYFFNILDDERGCKVGIVWVNVKTENDKTSAFIYDLEVKDGERGKGFAAHTMLQVDEFSKEKGATEICLHVFANNVIAFHLYEKLGYRIRKTFYKKDGSTVMSFRMAKSFLE
ncbi:MAG TPA: GNAT family N-acetyltransferase [Anaerolineaceae bacterium]|nr:GNAT family N-acetyltransferase [Anaerolineaceae bacterium]